VKTSNLYDFLPSWSSLLWICVSTEHILENLQKEKDTIPVIFCNILKGNGSLLPTHTFVGITLKIFKPKTNDLIYNIVWSHYLKFWGASMFWGAFFNFIEETIQEINTNIIHRFTVFLSA